MAKFIRCHAEDTDASLEDPLSLYRNALAARPVGHVDRPSTLIQLAVVYFARFEKRRDEVEGARAEALLHEAMELSSAESHEKRAATFLLQLRAGRGVGPVQADDEPSVEQDSTSRSTDEDPWILSVQLLQRVQRFGDVANLQQVITLLEELVRSTSVRDDRYRGGLANLGVALLYRFNHLGELRAISTLRDVVNITPHGHPHKPGHLTNLGNLFKARFKRLGDLSDLEEAISTLRDATDLTPRGRPDKPARLNNLGNSFKARFEHLGNLSDLEDAISTLRDAVDLTPRGHPDTPGRLSNLSNTFVTRFKHLGELTDLEQAISLYLHAASAPTGPISVRFRASQKWISCARHIHHHSLLHAYSIAISLLPELAWIGFSLTHRYDELMRGANVVREAAASALDSGFPETAVEWLEQGRSIVWGELFQLRGSYEQLSSAHPDHAHRLRELSVALEHASATREKSLSALSEQTRSAARGVSASLQQEADRHRTLAVERDRLLQEIRGFPGFERFLLRKAFSQLRASAHSGPVVILNAAESRCDALIVLADVDHVIHVPLPTFTFQRSAGLQKLLEKLLGHARVVQCDDREGKSVPRGGVSWESILSTLWNGVVKPVLDALAFTVRDVVSFEFIPDPFICP